MNSFEPIQSEAHFRHKRAYRQPQERFRKRKLRTFNQRGEGTCRLRLKIAHVAPYWDEVHVWPHKAVPSLDVRRILLEHSCHGGESEGQPIRQCVAVDYESCTEATSILPCQEVPL